MFDTVALGEILIDFTMQGKNSQGQRIFAQNAGGAPANVVAAMAKLGSKTAFIGKVGNDMHGRFLKSVLEDCGIDNSGLVISDEYFTTLAFVNVLPDGEREFSFARSHGADKMLCAEEVPTELINNSKILHVGSVSLADEPSRNATFSAVLKAKENGVTVSFDPNYRANLWKSRDEAVSQMRKMAKYADLIKVSDEETELLTGEKTPEKAAEILIRDGAEIVAVTLGKDGAFVKTADGEKYVKGKKSNAVDATGAGDSFWGGFLHGFAALGKAPGEVSISEAEKITRIANATASLCVENYGAIPSMPTLKQVEERIAKNYL